MGKPAARLTDMHMCPMVTPGLPPIPHVGGPITGPGCPTVLIAGLPAAVMGDICVCVGPPDTIILGSTGVFFGGKPAARMGDQCAHGGAIVLGCPTVLIGETSSGSADGPDPLSEDVVDNASQAGKAIAQKQNTALNLGQAAEGVVNALEQKKPTPSKTEISTIACTLIDEDGNPMGNVKYEIELTDGSKRSGTTDSQGKVTIDGIEPGNCKVSFPDLHADEWI
jgi:uncharacterized Zn-binding protein involved in type VI secretion